MKNDMFQIFYFRTPLGRAYPRQSARGEHLLSNGLHNLKRKVVNHQLNINPTRNAKKAIHGLAYLFGFKYRKFMQDNFVRKTKYTYYQGKRCRLSTWIRIIRKLNNELQIIHAYANISTLLRSRYAKDIRIAGINRYYHPRKRHYVRNARTKLAQLGNDRRYRFVGTFQRFGSKSNGHLTILLTNILCHNKLVTNHLWFNATKAFLALGHLDQGQRIYFNARVRVYKKGYLPKDFIKHYDYELTYPSHIRKAQKGD